MSNRMIAVAAAMLLGTFAAGAMAAQSAPAAAATAAAAPAGNALQVAIYDPVTKTLRAPTPEEAAALAKSINRNREQKASLPNTSNRPRTEAESLKTLRKVRVNGYDLEIVDTPESEMNNLVGKRDAKGHLIAVHPGDNPQAKEAIQ